MEQNEKIMMVKNVFDQKNATYEKNDVLLLVAVVDGFNNRGYTVGYDEAAHFLFNQRNVELVITQGITKTIKAMSLMKLGPIRKGVVIGRNEKCPCGSGNKYKKCCINKK